MSQLSDELLRANEAYATGFGAIHGVKTDLRPAVSGATLGSAIP